MTPAILLHALTLRNRFTLDSPTWLPLFREAGLQHYFGDYWVVGPQTYGWVCRQRGWPEKGKARALG